MNVLLIQPPNYYDGKSREQVFFPIGLGYIAGAIIDEGHEVRGLKNSIDSRFYDFCQFFRKGAVKLTTN